MRFIPDLSIPALALAALLTGASLAAQCSTSWQNVGAGISGGPGRVDAVTWLTNGDLVVGGQFTTAGGSAADSLARWDGSSWSALAGNLSLAVSSLTALPNGDLVVGGFFSSIGGIAARRIARWDGTSWSPFGSGMSGGVLAVSAMPNGDLVAGGDFGLAGGVTVNSIARWDGTSWSALGAGMGASSPSGSVQVGSIVLLPNGDLIAGGSFATAGGVTVNNIARWDGTSWSALGSGMNAVVRAVTLLPGGDVIAGGDFTTVGGVAVNHIARWDGASWTPLGTGTSGLFSGGVLALTTAPNGDVVAGGFFSSAGGVSAERIARWDGASWSAFGAGVNGYSVIDLAMSPRGELAVGGWFPTAGGMPALNIALLTTNCPATTSSIATSCVGPAGPMTLVADAPPWTGATFASTATGFAASSLGVSVVGLTGQNLPLAQLHPTALPNCDLLASIEAVQLLVPTAGTASLQFRIPNDPAFAGVQLTQQFVQGELDLQGALVSLSSSNALQLTVGAF